MFATLLSAVSWTPGVHTLGWCRAPVLRTASLLLSANSASMGGDEVQPVSLDGFFSFFNTLSAAFNRFDLDGDGTITTAEIGAVLRECGETPSDGEVAQLVAQFDDNNNGTVDFDEFCALVTRSRSDSVNSQVESKVAEIAREAIATDEGAAGAPLQQTGADGGMVGGPDGGPGGGGSVAGSAGDGTASVIHGKAATSWIVGRRAWSTESMPLRSAFRSGGSVWKRAASPHDRPFLPTIVPHAPYTGSTARGLAGHSTASHVACQSRIVR